LFAPDVGKRKQFMKQKKSKVPLDETLPEDPEE